MELIRLNEQNIESEHLCCAISDPKHQAGVEGKKEWLKRQMPANHVFCKGNERGKVFLEYADAELAWAPIVAPNYLYLYCLWVSGKFQGQGYSAQLMNDCIEDARRRGKHGICAITGTKKLPFLSDPKHLEHFGFQMADRVGQYELMALSFHEGAALPRFTENAGKQQIEGKGYTVFYTLQCPLILNCLQEMKEVAGRKQVDFSVTEVDSCRQAQEMPCVFHNFALFYDGKFITHQLLNGNSFEKLIGERETSA